MQVVASNAHWFWASSHDMSRKLLIEEFWCYCQNFWFWSNFLSLSSAEISDFNSDDEFSKELVKSNAFMFFCFDSIEITDFEFWFWLKLKFLISTLSLICVACFYIIYTLIARLMSFELMLWVCIKRIIWVYFN